MTDSIFTYGTVIDPNQLEKKPVTNVIRDYGSEFVEIPEIYQQVEYIEGDGIAYINTDYRPNASSSFTGKFIMSTNDMDSYEYMFGVRDSYHSSTSWELKYQSSTKTLIADVGRITADTVYVPAGGNLYFDLSRSKTILNVSVKSIEEALDDNSDYYVYIFALNNHGIAENFTQAKLYSFKILEANDIVKKFIPCYRKSDSVIGLYDVMNDKFYTSANSGVFKKGPKVHPPSYDQIINGELYLNVFDTDFNQVAVIDQYTSLIWSDRFDESGDFELILPYSKEIMNLLKQDYFCTINLSEHGMIIEKQEIETDLDDNPTLTISGRSLESILERRVILTKKVFGSDSNKVSLQDSIKTLLEQNIISPSNEKRKINNFNFIESTDAEVTKLKINETYNGEDLYSIINSLCTDKHIGFKIALDYWNHFNFSLYAGTDRSYEQNKNDFVIFSPYYDNLKNSRFFSSNEEYRNFMVVSKNTGMEESSSETETIVSVYKGTEPSGIDRREVYVNSSELQKNTKTELTDGKLRAKGKKKLAVDYKVKTGFEGDIIPDVLYIYRTDYFVGDKVQFEDAYGNSKPLYISEVVISKDASGLTVIPTFKEIEEEWEV